MIATTSPEPQAADGGLSGHVLTPDKAWDFILAGKAIFTVINTATGSRFTFRVADGGPEKPHFVSVFTGTNNGSSRDYTYLGVIQKGQTYYHGRISTIGEDAASAKAFAWVWKTLARGQRNLGPVEIHHCGRCGRCGRLLTVPASIETGLGPECAEKMGQ